MRAPLGRKAWSVRGGHAAQATRGIRAPRLGHHSDIERWLAQQAGLALCRDLQTQLATLDDERERDGAPGSFRMPRQGQESERVPADSQNTDRSCRSRLTLPPEEITCGPDLQNLPTPFEREIGREVRSGPRENRVEQRLTVFLPDTG